MRWLKANNQASSSSSQPSKKDQKAAAKKGNNYQKASNKATDKSSESMSAASNRTVIVFNPLLWKEEIVNLVEDWNNGVKTTWHVLYWFHLQKPLEKYREFIVARCK